MNEIVVILHGIFRSGSSMKFYEKHLTKHGFKVINVDYASTKKGLEDIIDDVHQQLVATVLDENTKVHFLGYSMGGLVARAYLKKYRPQNLGRVVMVGTPNKGSELADFLKKYKIFAKIAGPAGQQLVTDQKDFAHLFGDVDYELGVVAGDLNISPIAWLVFRKPNDSRVSVESTKLEGMKEHITVKSSHAFLWLHPKVIRLSVRFLKTGNFTDS